MTSDSKKQTITIIALLCVLGIIFVLAKIIPMGINGDIAQAKPYIIVGVVLFIVGLPAAFLRQANGGEVKADPELEMMRVEMQTLSQAGKHIRRPGK